MENSKGTVEETEDLKQLLLNRKSRFWEVLKRRSLSASSFSELVTLSNLRKRAARLGFANGSSEEAAPQRIAFVGGSTLYPLSELIEHLLTATAGSVELFTGDYNNYRSEIVDSSSSLYRFEPELVIILPDEQTCRYTGKLTDSPDLIAEEAERVSRELLDLCSLLRERIAAEVILCNFILPSYYDLGPLRSQSPASDWNFKKSVNLALGFNAPEYVQICDLEFLAYRMGGLDAREEKSWFESKQLCSPPLQVELSKEIAHLVNDRKKAPKKVLVLDLDDTLWGGVIGDDGMGGIDLGDTSPRGEAFKAFQSFILSLTERGVLLGVCSKNDFANAIEPFRTHPEMILKEEHLVSFKANWKPKAENLIDMANELNLGLDSFIFVDDNPSEIEMVRQFAPEVTTILLEADPALFVRQLQESRLFERSAITNEDGQRTRQYRSEAKRREVLKSAVDMDAYLNSLEMVGVFSEFTEIDLPRIVQLINKSNQFNLTTIRRSESEIEDIMAEGSYVGLTLRLSDRFGDHGLISVVICVLGKDSCLEIDTWLMSCRVLKRQVEHVVMNEIALWAKRMGCERIRGAYSPTPKNGMVKEHYTSLGFTQTGEEESADFFELDLNDHEELSAHIAVERRYERDERIQRKGAEAAAGDLR